MDHEKPRHEADAACSPAVALPLHLRREGGGDRDRDGSPAELSTSRIASYLSLGDAAPPSRPPGGSSISAPLPKWGRGKNGKKLSDGSISRGGMSDEEYDWFVGDQAETPAETETETPAGQPTGENDQPQPRAATPANERSDRGGRQDHHHHRQQQRRQQEQQVAAPPPPPRQPAGSKRRRLLQQELAKAVFAHPSALANYCLDAYNTARKLKASRTAAAPDGGRDHLDCGSGDTAMVPLRLVTAALVQGGYYASVPPPVLLEASRLALVLVADTFGAAVLVSSTSASVALGSASSGALLVMDVLTSISPGDVLSAVLDAQRSAMDRTGDALVGGIQSVASGVGSVSGAALNRLSRQGLALAGELTAGSSKSRKKKGHGYGDSGRGVSHGRADISSSRLFRRLHRMDDVSRLMSYSEGAGKEAFGKTAKKRAQRMMHYQVSFRPFFATIQPKDAAGNANGNGRKKVRRTVSFERSSADGSGDGSGDSAVLTLCDGDSLCSDDESSGGGSRSLFMCTPTSFPPTPRSRLHHFERGSRFTENVVFLARDQLRVESNLVHGTDEQTRLMSRALLDGARLAVFDAAGLPRGVSLSCGQHIATRTAPAGSSGGTALHASVRGMIPVMRNSHVYFEISVSPPPSHSSGGQCATLSVGLSTLEMPLDAIVGAWRGSAGLCSVGQVLHEGRWRPPPPPYGDGGTAASDFAYGSDSTVGCLVYIDDGVPADSGGGGRGESAATARVTFSVNGAVVPSLDRPSDGSGILDGGPTLSLPVPRPHELFPTVTLHSPPGCSVMCRFSREDVLAGSRGEVGAPSGVVVYAVDGSVVLEAGRDEDGQGDLDEDSSVDEEEYLDVDSGDGEAYLFESVDL